MIRKLSHSATFWCLMGCFCLWTAAACSLPLMLLLMLCGMYCFREYVECEFHLNGRAPLEVLWKWMRHAAPIAALLFAVPCFGQAVPVSTSGMPIPAAAMPQIAPVSTPLVASCSQVNIGVDYVHFTSGGKSFSGTMEEAAHPFTDCSKKFIGSAGFVMIQIPGANTSFYMIGPRVDMPLANIFPKIDAALKSLVLFGGFGLGTAQVSPPNAAQTNHFAYGFQGGLAVIPGSIFGASTQFEVKGGIVGYNRNVFRANTLSDVSSQFAAAVVFNLGSKAPQAPPVSTAK